MPVIAAYQIHTASLVSVWCFFAAILSLIVYLHFKAQQFKKPLVGFVSVKNLTKTAETETGSSKYLCIGLVVLAVAPIVAKRLGVYAKIAVREGDEAPSAVVRE